MSFTYWVVLAVQGSIIPVLWVVFWPRIKPHLRFLGWSLPVAWVIGFLWDYLMGLWQVWEWLDTSGQFVGVLPIEDVTLFLPEIYLIAATLVLIFKAGGPKQRLSITLPET